MRNYLCSWKANGTYQKDSSYFGINNKIMEIDDNNYSDSRKVIDMLANKVP